MASSITSRSVPQASRPASPGAKVNGAAFGAYIGTYIGTGVGFAIELASGQNYTSMTILGGTVICGLLGAACKVLEKEDILPDVKSNIAKWVNYSFSVSSLASVIALTSLNYEGVSYEKKETVISQISFYTTTTFGVIFLFFDQYKKAENRLRERARNELLIIENEGPASPLISDSNSEGTV